MIKGKYIKPYFLREIFLYKILGNKKLAKRARKLVNPKRTIEEEKEFWERSILGRYQVSLYSQM